MLSVSISVKRMYEQWKSDSVAQTDASSNIWDTLGFLTWHSYANKEILAFLGYHIWQDSANSPVSEMTWESFVEPIESRPVCVFHHLSSPEKKISFTLSWWRTHPLNASNIIWKMLYMNFTWSAKHEHENSEVPAPLCHILCSLGCQIMTHSPGDKCNYVVES